MANAWTVAALLGFEFRFVWPRGRFRELDDPTEILATDFLDAYEMEEERLGHATQIVADGIASLAALREAVEQAGRPCVVIVEECMAAFRFAEQSAEEAAELFRASFQALRWSPVIAALRAEIAALDPGIRAAMHVRAGDFVMGIRYGAQAGEDWTNFLPAEKYVATGILQAIAARTAASGERMVVFSDNEEAVARIRQANQDLVTPVDLLPLLDALTEAQRAVAEILLLARMERIVAPGVSAFSQLAAKLGGAGLLSAVDALGDEDALATVRGFLRDHPEPPHGSDPLLARDACWYLDLYADQLDAGERAALAALSAGADPRFCRAWNWLAATRALARDAAGFAHAAAKARALAEGAQRIHDDPLVETLAVAASSRMLLSLLARRSGRLARRFRAARALARRVLARFGLSQDETDRALAILPGLRPHQVHLHAIIMNLRYQQDILRQAEWLGLDLAPHVAELLDGQGFAAWSDWRRPGQRTMPAASAYPSVLRLIESFTILLTTAFGRALGGVATRPAPQGSIDIVACSPTGLHWARGWSYSVGAGDRGRLVGVADGEGRISWGVTHLRRADVAAHLDDPRARDAGYLVPVTPVPDPSVRHLLAVA